MFEHNSNISELSGTYKYFDEDNSKSFFRKTIKRIAVKTGLKRALLKSRITRENIGLIYSNTVINFEMLSMFSGLNVPIISHCHELESIIHLTGIEDYRKTKELTNYFIVVSEAVKNNLIENQGVSSDQIGLEEIKKKRIFQTSFLKLFHSKFLRQEKKM